MGFWIAAGVLVFFALIIIMVSGMLEKNAVSFDQNQRLGKAVVKGYQRQEQSNWYSLLVSIPELDDGKLHLCTGKGIKPARYPVDTVVDVRYAPETKLGISVVEVHLADYTPNTHRVGRGLRVAGLVLAVLALLLAAVGVIICFI